MGSKSRRRRRRGVCQAEYAPPTTLSAHPSVFVPSDPKDTLIRSCGYDITVIRRPKLAVERGGTEQLTIDTVRGFAWRSLLGAGCLIPNKGLVRMSSMHWV